MPLTISQKPLAEVAETLSAKTPIGSVLRSAEWANVPAALRESAFFSARVESARALTDAQAGLRKILSLARDPNGAISMDRGKWIAEMQKLSNSLGLRNTDPAKRGGLEDFGSERRLKLIYEQQIGQAQSKAYYMSGQDPDVLDAWPAQELVRMREPKGGATARRNWIARWDAAGGKFYDGGRMIALKTDPIWVKISRFDRPYPPFDFSSGMGLEEIDRETAEALGLIQPGETIEPSLERDAEEIRASVKGLPDEMREALQAAFGDQIDLSGDEARWVAATPPPPPKPSTPPKPTTSPKKLDLDFNPPETKPATEPVASQPAGTPVTKAVEMNYATKKEAARHTATLAAIDKVHGDGPLKAIPFNNKIAKGSLGTYFSYPGAAVSVGVKKGARSAGTVLTHEVGHWIDHIGIASPTKMASESDLPLMKEWQQAVKNSAAWKKLPATITPKHLGYFQSLRETWARAYAQFIAVESGSPQLLADLAEFKKDFPEGCQWEEADFEPIRLAMRKVFAELGWTK